MTVRWGTPALAPGTEEKLRRMLADPRRRATASRILNDQSRILLKIAEELADNEIHRRPDDRRSPESLAHGKHYNDSFEIVPAKEFGYQIRAGIRNTHPFARAVENGSRRHDIPPKSEFDPLLFPFQVGQGPGGVGRLGNFPVAWSDAPTRTNTTTIDHPGANPHRILRRARDKFRKQGRRALNR